MAVGGADDCEFNDAMFGPEKFSAAQMRGQAAAAAAAVLCARGASETHADETKNTRLETTKKNLGSRAPQKRRRRRSGG
jgi:hypothetical protein